MQSRYFQTKEKSQKWLPVEYNGKKPCMKSKIREIKRVSETRNESQLTEEALSNLELSNFMVSFPNDLNENCVLNSTFLLSNFSEKKAAIKLR